MIADRDLRREGSQYLRSKKFFSQMEGQRSHQGRLSQGYVSQTKRNLPQMPNQEIYQNKLMEMSESIKYEEDEEEQKIEQQLEVEQRKQEEEVKLPDDM